MENKNVVIELKKAIMGKRYDNALIQRSEDINGGYLVPNEEMHVIEEFKRQQISLKPLCRVVQTNSGKGQLPFCVEASNMMMACVDEGQEIPTSSINFGVVSWNVKTYADIIPVTAQILEDEACGLMSAIGQRLARKIVYTENNKIIEALLANAEEEQASSFADGSPLIEALNLKLDPVHAMNAKIICNQTYFNMLDQLKDENNRGMLQPMLGDATKKQFMGKEIIVLSDAELNFDGFIVGDLNSGILFADKIGIEVATSRDAGFTKNVHYVRCICRFDVKVIDPKAVVLVKIA